MFFSRHSSSHRAQQAVTDMSRELKRIAKAVRQVNHSAANQADVLAAQLEVETSTDLAQLDRSATLAKIQELGTAYAEVLAAVMDFPLARMSYSPAVTAAKAEKRK